MLELVTYFHAMNTFLAFRTLQLTKEQLADLEQEYRVKDKEVKRRCMKDKQQWYDSKAGEAEKAAIEGDHKIVKSSRVNKSRARK